MDSCDRYGIQAQLYFDNELKGRELEDFRRHLLRCRSCEDYIQRAGELSEVLNSSRPLFSAPDELLKRVTEIIQKQSELPSDAPNLLHAHIPHLLLRAVRRVDSFALRCRAVAVAALVVVVVALALVPTVTWQVGAASYADAALQTHRSYLAGNLPPEVLSSSPQAVTEWFTGKVPFNFRLPASQPPLDSQQAYRLIGARLVKYRDNRAALVVYEMNASKISLMVTSDRSASVAGGDEIQSGGLTFHHHQKNGLNIITWSNHGLTYALVSSVQGPVRGSCLVCHQNMADQNRFRDPR